MSLNKKLHLMLNPLKEGKLKYEIVAPLFQILQLVAV